MSFPYDDDDSFGKYLPSEIIRRMVLTGEHVTCLPERPRHGRMEKMPNSAICLYKRTILGIVLVPFATRIASVPKNIKPQPSHQRSTNIAHLQITHFTQNPHSRKTRFICAPKSGECHAIGHITYHSRS